MENSDIQKLVIEIKNRKIKLLQKEKISEVDLQHIAYILKSDDFDVRLLINMILNYQINENCDWNIGSLLQHFDYNDIILALQSIPTNQRGYLYDSIGFCWAMGECPYKNEHVIEFLYEVINNGRNSESWWKAAFALEKITGKDAINNLKRSVKNYGIITLDEALEDLTDKKNIISILLNSNSSNIKENIYPYLKKRFNETDNEKEIINIVWLFGRLRLYDQELFMPNILKIYLYLETN